MEHFFSPNSNGHLRSDAHQSQTIGGDANVDHRLLKLLGGYSQIIEGIYPPTQRWARATSKVAPLPLLALKSSVAPATRLQK